MTYGVGAGAFVGLAAESPSGTYTAPTHFLVLRDESMQFKQSTNWRRPLRGIADVATPIRGDSHVEGTTTVEVTHDTLPLILQAARGTLVKTGSSPPYTWTFTPSAIAVPASTVSLTVVRDGVTFGYVGCVVSKMKFSVDNGELLCAVDWIGIDEASQTLPTPTYITTTPFGMGQYNLQIPLATQVYDADKFDLEIDDGATPEFRLQDLGVTAAVFVKYGERKVTMTIDRDFQSRSDFDAFKVLTAQGIQLKAVQSAGVAEVDFLVDAAVKDVYDIVGTNGQAELIRANITYMGTYKDATSRAYQIVCITTLSAVS